VKKAKRTVAENLAIGNSMVVEHLSHNLKVKLSCLAAKNCRREQEVIYAVNWLELIIMSITM
jgi:hypothetical protein